MNNSPFLQALRREQNNVPPIWFMRQAGRYLPEYQKIRKNYKNFLDMCKEPRTCAELALQPIERFDLDAAVIFSDILMLPYGLNQKVEFKKNFGPLLGPLNLELITKVDEIDFLQKLYPVYKSIKKVSENNLIKNKNIIIIFKIFIIHNMIMQIAF